MAEGFLKSILENQDVKVLSAGVQIHGLNPTAIEVMREIGIDISKQKSNHIYEYEREKIDILITVCDHAYEVCPFIPGVEVKIHHNFSDPAKVKGSDEEILNAFRITRNEIQKFCLELKENLFPKVGNSDH